MRGNMFLTHPHHIRFHSHLKFSIFLSTILFFLITTTTTAQSHGQPHGQPGQPQSQPQLDPFGIQCPAYATYAAQRHEPFSTGIHSLSYARPAPECRTFFSQELEDAIARLKGKIADPDLFRLFENCWPSTLDTTVAWRGFAADEGTGDDKEEDDVVDQLHRVLLKPIDVPPKLPPMGPYHPHSKRLPPPKPKPKEEQKSTDQTPKRELTFIVTGDIPAMWLRDSANQLLAYTSLLRPNSSTNSIASLFRGAINLQVRYILSAPFCNAFQAPIESNISRSSSANSDRITPSFDYRAVFSCQWELDSVASFLQLSAEYYKATNDLEFFASFSSIKGHKSWSGAVSLILSTAESMMIDSYSEDGEWQHTPYTYCAPYGGTPINECNGSPHKGHIGLVRSFHRPSDDACWWQYLVPSNMMFAVGLEESLKIMSQLEELELKNKKAQKHTEKGDDSGKPKKAGKEKDTVTLSAKMRSMAAGIRLGITEYAHVPDKSGTTVLAYELDGLGSHSLMDDANLPSLLSAPYLGYLPRSDPVYAATRARILSSSNPYFSWGPTLSGIGSPHTLPGRAWPMALCMGILTSEDDGEIEELLGMLVRSTDGLGVMHESVDSRRGSVWSRSWFSWANGLFGQVVLDLERRKPHLLKLSFQGVEENTPSPANTQKTRVQGKRRYAGPGPLIMLLGIGGVGIVIFIVAKPKLVRAGYLWLAARIGG